MLGSWVHEGSNNEELETCTADRRQKRLGTWVAPLRPSDGERYSLLLCAACGNSCKTCQGERLCTRSELFSVILLSWAGVLCSATAGSV